MYGIFLDGESKTGKTTVGLAIQKALSQNYKVHSAAAGSFYRRLTLLALEMHGGYSPGDTSWLETYLQRAIDSGSAYDETRDWTKTHSKEVDELVSVAGQFEFMQAAGREWWYKTADLALSQSADVLLVDGRNPRAKLASWRADRPGVMPIALDLCVYCSPEVAGERYARVHSNGKPTPEQVAVACNSIAERRRLDRTRAATPYVEPENQLLFEPRDDDAALAIRKSFEDVVDEPPRVIRYDTSNSPIEVNLLQAGSLANFAIDYLKQR